MQGKYIAYVFIRDGGATTRESYQLTILKNNKKLYNSGGNVFVSDFLFSIEWVSDKELYVYNTTPAGIFRQMRTLYGISIKYKHMKTE